MLKENKMTNPQLAIIIAAYKWSGDDFFKRADDVLAWLEMKDEEHIEMHLFKY
jgi:hypothetical protein